MFCKILPNRGSTASTSVPASQAWVENGQGHDWPSYACRQPSTRRQVLFRSSKTRRSLSARSSSVFAPATEADSDSSEQPADDWDTVWVDDALHQKVFMDHAAEEEDSDHEANHKVPSRKRLPAEMRCFDTASILVKGGDGGKGCVAFRREKHVPRGGPAGGNGGNGGNVWAVADEGLNSLGSFRKQLHFRALPGAGGGGKNRHGPNGTDTIIRVPKGTIFWHRDGGEHEPPLAELLTPGSRALLAAGGRGGRGNASFKTAVNNAPQLAEVGEAGQELWLNLELKLVADVGMIGVPNAGKSTLLSVVSAAKPKVANYPFTTLVPNLGVCETDFRTIVFADVPGLLEGAHSGVGLGHEFLRHCQRSRVLVHIIDGTSPDPVGDYHAICTELELFNPDLLEKPQVVAYNKVDLPDSSDYWDEVHEHLLGAGVAPENALAISAVTGQGVIALVRRLHAVLDSLPPKDEGEPTTDAVNVTEVARGTSAARIDDFIITPQLGEGRVFVVEGQAIERFAQMTNWGYYEAALRFQKVLEASGINKALRAKGICEGDTVVLGDMEMEWSDDQSEGALYTSWLAERKAQGGGFVGSARWPHAS